MSLGGDYSSNEKLIHKAIDSGINYFDTADLYQFGLNEQSVGKSLKGKRNDVILATKGGNEWGDGIDGWRWNPSKSYLKNAVKKSLQRLGTDYIDLYQLHGGTIDDPIDETIEAFEELVQEGAIRYYGISSIRPNVIKKYLKKSNIVSVMMQYSMLDRRPEEWFHLFNENNVSVIARGPLAKGILTSNHENKLNNDGYLTYSKNELDKILPALMKIAKDNGYTFEQLALRYTIDRKVVASAIPGASNLSQLEANVSASTLNPIDAEHINKINSFLKRDLYEKHRD